MERSEVISSIKTSLRIEQKCQEKEWLDTNEGAYKQMRSKGLLIYPLKIKETRYGYADYPIVSFSFSFDLPGNNFKSGVPISFFNTQNNEELVNGSILRLEGREGEMILYTSEFPDWLDENSLGVRLVPDSRTFDQMHGVLQRIDKNEDEQLTKIFDAVYGLRDASFLSATNDKVEIKNSKDLNESQIQAVNTIVSSPQVSIVHGPPGTGKTTTLVAAVSELVSQGKKVVVTAPSNAAIDHFSKKLIQQGIKIIRSGNLSRIDESLVPFTFEGILSDATEQKQIKKLKKRSDEFRKLANQYKRNFGKEEREQRKRLKKEVRSIQAEIKSITSYIMDKAIVNADVVLATPIGLTDEVFTDKTWDVLMMDEAGQCISPLGWLAMKKAKTYVFAGDPFQLPPTVFSDEAKRKGLDVSILELFFRSGVKSNLLDVQYRMPPELIEFSSNYFYDGKLKSVKSTNADSLYFFDTAGADYSELNSEGAISNEQELEVLLLIIEELNLSPENCVFISPYAEQVYRAKAKLKGIKCSTIDSFQGQEAPVIIVSLVRSNDDGNIGFLKEYRRMNVLLTRAKEKLILVGDSATLGSDTFYQGFLTHVEKRGNYRSVFELMV